MRNQFAVHDYLDFATLDHHLDPVVFTFLERAYAFLLGVVLREKS